MIKYIAYNLSHAVAKGVYDARNSVGCEKETREPSLAPKQSNQEKPTLSNAERRIRSDWIQSLLIYLLGSLAISAVCYFFMLYHGNSEVAIEGLFDGLMVLSSIAISTAIMYYFAYVRFGTKWIGWFLIVSPIRTALETIKDLAETIRLPDLATTGLYYVLIVYLLLLSLYVYFWMNCKRLYYLNKSIKKRKIEREDSGLEPVKVA